MKSAVHNPQQDDLKSAMAAELTYLLGVTEDMLDFAIICACCFC